MKIKIIFEDQDLWLINKPPSLVVNRSETVKKPTLQDWLEEQLPPLIELEKQEPTWSELVPADFDEQYGTPLEIFKKRLGLVHRLDKDTSGVMVLAKNPGSLVNLLQQFKQRQTKKRYLCLAHGKFRVPRGNIRAPLGRANYNRQKMAVGPGGRKATTRYEVAKFYPAFKPTTIEEKFNKQQQRRLSIYQGFSLVDCWPKTGRTHQVRVHLKHWRHPLVGDEKYAGKKRAKLDPVWCPRQFLHAAELSFIHPRRQREVKFVAELSQDLQAVLKLLMA